MTLILVIGGIALLLMLGWLVDRLERRHGHQPADPSRISRACRDARRDAAAMGELPSMISDPTWTALSRNAEKTHRDPPQ